MVQLVYSKVGVAAKTPEPTAQVTPGPAQPEKR